MRYLLRTASLILTLSCAGCSVPTDDAAREFILSHLERYPAAEVRDVYKLLYQWHFGPGHAIPSGSAALRFLEEEIAGMGTGPSAPLMEACDPDGRMVRVHLRPYAAAGYAPDSLAAAMLRSAERMSPDTAAFISLWTDVTSWTEHGELPLDARAMAAFTREVREQGYPPVHHSPAYTREYRPAYRVVLRQELHLGAD